MDGQNGLKRFLETRYENNIKVQTIKSYNKSQDALQYSCSDMAVDHVSISLPWETKNVFLLLHLF